jgi:ABC-type sugar transport system ATPase subunit
MSDVRFRGATKRYGDVVALDALDLDIEPGEFVSLLGPSGSGKSTTLNLLAGLAEIDGGTIHVGGVDVTTLAPERRDLAMVFQNYALYPHMTVFENVAFPLRARRPRLCEREIEAKVAAVTATLGIGDLLARYPKEISGGQQQRVALGRGMVRGPKVFLLDEPLSNLDARLRIRMRHDLKALHRTIGSTIVYVTHDQAEAMTLSSRIAIFDRGRLQQFATPDEIYNRPVNQFVANFVGDRETNFIEGALAAQGEAAIFAGQVFAIDLRRGVAGIDARAGGALRLGLRPEAIQPVDAPGPNVLEAEILQTELSGPELFFYARIADGTELGGRCAPRARIEAGQRALLHLDAARAHVFDARNGVCVSHGVPS